MASALACSSQLGATPYVFEVTVTKTAADQYQVVAEGSFDTSVFTRQPFWSASNSTTVNLSGGTFSYLYTPSSEGGPAGDPVNRVETSAGVSVGNASNVQYWYYSGSSGFTLNLTGVFLTEDFGSANLYMSTPTAPDSLGAVFGWSGSKTVDDGTPSSQDLSLVTGTGYADLDPVDQNIFYNFTATAGSIVFGAGTAEADYGTGVLRLVFVDATSAIPEPASAPLIMAALCGGLVMTKRRKRVTC